MAIEVYWNEKVRMREDFKVSHKISKDGQEWDEHQLNHINVFFSEGRMHSIIHYLDQPLPAWMEGLYSELSFCEWFPIEPKREKGVYKLRSARADLDTGRSGKDQHHSVRIVGQKLEDMAELYNLIRSGRILPSESWEDEQMTETQNIAEHLKAIFRLLKQKIFR